MCVSLVDKLYTVALVRITVYSVMAPFWSRRSGGCHCISTEVEERTRIWIALGAADGSGGWEINHRVLDSILARICPLLNIP